MLGSDNTRSRDRGRLFPLCTDREISRGVSGIGNQKFPRCRIKLGETAVVMGGVHPSFMPQEALRHCDAVVIGEVELVIARLLDDLEQGSMRGTYRADRLHPMAGMPMPRYDLLKKHRYVNRTFVQTSRGCHHGCTFCAEPLMNGLKFRYRPVDEVMHEIDNCGARTISINDADFFGTPDRPKEVMRALKGRGIQWQAGVTSKLAQDDRMLELAAASGCTMLSIGFESISRDTLKSVHKHVNQPDTFAALVEKVHSYGIMVFGLFMFGFDGDDRSVFDNTSNFNIDADYDAAPVTDRRAPVGTFKPSRWKSPESDLDADFGRQRDQRFLELEDRRGHRVELVGIVRHVLVDVANGAQEMQRVQSGGRDPLVDGLAQPGRHPEGRALGRQVVGQLDAQEPIAELAPHLVEQGSDVLQLAIQAVQVVEHSLFLPHGRDGWPRAIRRPADGSGFRRSRHAGRETAQSLANVSPSRLMRSRWTFSFLLYLQAYWAIALANSSRLAPSAFAVLIASFALSSSGRLAAKGAVPKPKPPAI